MDLAGFAKQWIEDWNSHDIERVLDHYATEVEFRSPVAQRCTGDGIVRGRDALRSYWGPAFALRPQLNFTMRRAFVGYRSIAIHYGDELGRDIIETLVFDENGKATFGCGCYSNERAQ